MASKITVGLHKFTASGITFNYEVCGSGPLVVFHGVGWGPSRHLYRNSFTPLESDFTLLYFEPRTSGPADDMSTKQMGSDVELLREHLEVEKLSIVGHSNGGAIGLTYAEERPERVEKLALINFELQGFSSDNFMKYAQARKDDPVYGPALQEIINRDKNPPKTGEEFQVWLNKTLPWFFHDTTKTHLMAEAMNGGSASVFNYLNQARCDGILKFDAVAGLGKVKAKTLVIHGEDDAMCSLAAARKAAEEIPGARLEVIKEAGHLPWLEQPDAFFPVLREFLKD